MRTFGLDVASIGVATVFVVYASATAQPADLRTTSQIKGIAFKTLAVLPEAPAGGETASDCDTFIVKATSEAGKAVAGHGWSVTSEARLGPYQVVGFAGHLQQETSGTCEISQGNVGIFDGTRLIAIAYVPRSSKQSIGKVKPLEGGNVRVWSGDVLPAPIGDIQLANDGVLRLGPLAAHESFCHGKATVPNIYDVPIDQARKALASNGWAPVRRKPEAEEDNPGQILDLIHRGIVETDGCAGTGLNFCSFDYRGAGGSLAVYTAGEWDADRGEFPRVADYQMQCR